MSDLREAFEGARQTELEQDAEIARLKAALLKAKATMSRVLDCSAAAIRAECGGCSDALESGCDEIETLFAPTAESPDA